MTPYARSGSWRGKRPAREELPNENGSGYDHNAPKPNIACCHPHEIITLLVHCTNYAAYCYHQNTLPVAQFADDVLFEEIARRCRCTRCGKKGAEIKPDWSTSKAFKKRCSASKT